MPVPEVLPGHVWTGRDLSNHLVQVDAWVPVPVPRVVCCWCGRRGTRSVGGGKPGLCTAAQLQHQIKIKSSEGSLTLAGPWLIETFTCG